MHSACRIVAALAYTVTAVAASSNSSLNPLLNSGCQELAARYPGQLFYPDNPGYTNETTHFWSEATILSPYCVFTPETADDVAQALSMLRSTQTQFAVRGGGHMPVKAAASIDQGVLIALTELNTLQLSKNGSVAQIGPGNTWGDVYDMLGNSGRLVIGGRYSPVGVSGLLLGGGMSYYSGVYGWAANHIVNYQLVTANSSIIDVNAASAPDLFWALKGGSSNFGIVTRFDLATYAEPLVFAGTLEANGTYVDQFLDALTSYLAPGGGVEDSSSALVPALFVFPPLREVVVDCVLFHNSAQNAPASLANFTSIPAISNTAHVRSYNDFLTETVAAGNTSFRDSFYSVALRATPDAIRLLNTTIVPAALDQLAGVENSFIGLSFQPVTQSWLKAAQAAGGDALDLNPADGDFIAFNLFQQWSKPEDDDLNSAFAQNVLGQVQQAAQAEGMYYPFIYLNDAAAGEDVFALYGGGKSLPRLRATRKAWDPQGVFQYMMPGGFKVGV